jgi:DNA-binding IclR family transcriptional regulator
MDSTAKRRQRERRSGGSARHRERAPRSVLARRGGVRVLERAIGILQCFDEVNVRLTLHEIAERTGIHKATAFRILTTLVDERIIDQPILGGPYELGFFALGCADAILGGSMLWRKAVPVMAQLRDELNETIVLAQRRGDQILNLDKMVRRQGIIEAPTVGICTPLHASPAGRAVLSTFTHRQLDAYFDDYAVNTDSPRALSEARAFRRQIENAKAAIADPASDAPGSLVPAVPIRDRAGDAVGALWVAIPAGRMNPALFRQCLRRLISAARRLTA